MEELIIGYLALKGDVFLYQVQASLSLVIAPNLSSRCIITRHDLWLQFSRIIAQYCNNEHIAVKEDFALHHVIILRECRYVPVSHSLKRPFNKY